MCELLGMNCNTPTDIVFSFEGFRKRGGITDNHIDGFGVAFFEGKAVRIFQDDNPSASSPIADLISQYPIHSTNVLAHIRKASQGKTSLENTHPFMRELWGENWLFTHNGHLEIANTFLQNEQNYYQPVGTTDSEAAFCYILNQLKLKFHQKPSKKLLFEAILSLSQNIRKLGIFNFILSNGEWFIAHASTLLHYITREAPFGMAKLIDDDISIDFSLLTTPNDRVTVIATLPLTDNEKWTQFAQNTLMMFEQGAIIYHDSPDKNDFMSIQDGLKLAAKVGAGTLQSE